MILHAHGIASILLAALALGAAACGQSASAEPQPAATPPAGSASAVAPAPQPKRATEISVLYSSEKKEWMEAATTQFRKDHPDVDVRLTAMGSLDAAQAIVDGKERPTVFSPADSLVENLVAADWKAAGKPDLFSASGEDAPQPLLITPLVYVAWEDRAAVLLKASGGSIGWKTIHAGVTANEGWPAIGGKASWGFVKLGHADPAHANSGLQALYSMTLDFYGKPSGLEVGDFLKPGYQRFVRDLEKGTPRPEASTTAFMTDMLRFGPSKYDVAVVYESVALAQIATAEGRWGKLKIYYPQTTLWSDHPAAILRGEWVNETQRAAARQLIAHLRSRPMQEMAMSQYGFRPADPSVPIRTGDPNNPFTRNADRGVKLDIPAMAPAPSGEVVRAMLATWTRVLAK